MSIARKSSDKGMEGISELFYGGGGMLAMPATVGGDKPNPKL